MTTRYAAYQAEMTADIAGCLESMSCQPILFAGSGLSRRYFGGPSWDELLAYLAKLCPVIDRDYAYYKQTLVSPLVIGEEFARKYQEWAWASGRGEFPSDLFNAGLPANIYIKQKISEHLSRLIPSSLDAVTDPDLKRELSALQNIRPHAVITTNYDQFLETLFPEYTPVIGQQIIKGRTVSVGELFKIHGCISEPESLVFTSADYDDFMRRKKYLSAKLLTFFTEHPLIFVGYGAGDPNIKAILSDIDEVLSENGSAIPNVYIVEWRPGVGSVSTPARERLVAVEGAKGVRIKAIETEDFAWVFEAFGVHNNHPQVNPKLLRTLMVRSYELVRTDIPKKTVQADFQMLEHAVDSQKDFAKLFGISTIADPSVISAQYPYTLTEVAKSLGYKSWNGVQPLLEKVKSEKGFDLKSSDNRYHHAVKYNKGTFHKYSHDAITLLKAVRDDPTYQI